jgi:hypothetical protein
MSDLMARKSMNCGGWGSWLRRLSSRPFAAFSIARYRRAWDRCPCDFKDARKFYLSRGFSDCPGELLMLAVTLPDVNVALDADT